MTLENAQKLRLIISMLNNIEVTSIGIDNKLTNKISDLYDYASKLWNTDSVQEAISKERF